MALYRIDVIETFKAKTPVMREDAREDAPALPYDYRLPNRGTVWGETLRAIRFRLGLTQQDLADRFGVSTRTIQSWESGANRPRPRRAAWCWKELMKVIRKA